MKKSFLLFFTSLLFSIEVFPQSDTRPNVVIIIGDDISSTDLGCYGHPSVKTPHIDALAASSVRFTNAYLTTSVCSPTRCSILTGRYPHNTGAPELSTPLPETAILLPRILKDHGYHTAQAGKWHIGSSSPRSNGNDVARAAFDVVGGGRSDGGGASGAESWVERLQTRPRDKPFFMWFASHDAHRSWDKAWAPVKYKPADVVVPPYHVDDEPTRVDYTNYYSEISRFDHFVGEVVRELKAQDVFDNTFIVVMADNGRPFCRDKTRLYDSGIKTPFVVSWPPNQTIGSDSHSLVSVIDLAPTVLDLAGIEPPESFQGRSFASILNNPDRPFRNYVFGEHNWATMEAHERMVRGQRYMLIQNNRPQLDGSTAGSSGVGNPSGQSLVAGLKAKTLTEIQGRIFRRPQPAIELYDCENDPQQLHNLASNPEHAQVLTELKAALQAWSRETGDTIPHNLTPDKANRRSGKELKGINWQRGETPGAARNAHLINRPGPF